MALRQETIDGAISLVTLDRPKSLNAFNGELRRRLIDALAAGSKDPAIRAIVLTGAERAFSAGADVTDFASEMSVEDQLNTEYASALSIIQTTDKPVIAAINGAAAGIGMSFALTCDLRVMSREAYLMSAFANIGLVPDGGLSWLLTREVGYARAYQLAIEAEKIGAEKCLALGLINRVVDHERVVPEALDWARSLTRRAPLALAATKRAFRAAAQDGLRNAMAFEAMLQKTLIAT
ncbi:MAG: enoyl-CoA hydratase/isomerase family protein, partial [Parvularculaceae bacterium]|nr:enoyl-CoA hydratase/isomerase family protein [Parvularculaceae bacterium]